ncbi:hypothetical protein BD410DRAFT_615399 [Rickenella mellea]|uniref:F-box domain-containing protein n=1 Tax=Rickenella mellea TaxID=50990 RepID=A0A4Y7PMJ6_9AGAM|nr:hypothetical protein BD410DRAFT_615399 [Rickenella mellea]
MMEDGIKRIPNEILVNIFHIGHRSTDNYSFLISVTHVCRRFRTLALQESTLWTRINAGRSQTSDKILALIGRSRQQDLDVTFINGGCEILFGMRTFYDTFQASSLRWTSLHTGSDSFQYIPVDLPLSRVRRLSFVKESTMEDVHNIPWMLPGLQIFHGINILPKFCYATPLLTICSLSFSEWYLDASGFMTCLSHLLCIEDLRLVFQDTTLSDDGFGADALLTMPAVQTFSVTFGDEGGTRLVKALLSRLVMTNLSRLIICSKDAIDASFVLEPLRVSSSGYFRVFGSPREIDVEILSTEGVDITPLLLEPLQFVRHLSIIIPHAKFIKTLASHQGGNEDPREKLGSLQSVRFINCHRIHEKQVENLADRLLENVSGRGLQLLEIFSCKGISKRFLMDMSHKLGDKISWRM